MTPYSCMTKEALELEYQKVLAEYDRVKNRNYKRFERGEWKLPGEETEKDMTFEQYTAWLMQAQAARRAYLCGEISGKEFGSMIHTENYDINEVV